MMLLWSLIVALATAGVGASLGATVNAKGVLEILGNSFGRPGFNTTFDYIVSNAHSFRLQATVLIYVE